MSTSSMPAVARKFVEIIPIIILESHAVLLVFSGRPNHIFGSSGLCGALIYVTFPEYVVRIPVPCLQGEHARWSLQCGGHRHPWTGSFTKKKSERTARNIRTVLSMERRPASKRRVVRVSYRGCGERGQEGGSVFRSSHESGEDDNTSGRRPFSAREDVVRRHRGAATHDARKVAQWMTFNRTTRTCKRGVR